MRKHTIKEQATKVVHYTDGKDRDAYHAWVDEHGKESFQANPDQLEDTITNKMWSNKTDTSLADVLIQRFLDEQGNFPTLSPQENQVLKLYTAGEDMQAIAMTLKIKKGTVQYYLERCSTKLKKLLNSVKDVEF